MTAQGVTEFAMVNVKDYEGFGFRKVWNPLMPSAGGGEPSPKYKFYM